jgi:hypothetical protein
VSANIPAPKNVPLFKQFPLLAGGDASYREALHIQLLVKQAHDVLRTDRTTNQPVIDSSYTGHGAFSPCLNGHTARRLLAHALSFSSGFQDFHLSPSIFKERVLNS